MNFFQFMFNGGSDTNEEPLENELMGFQPFNEEFSLDLTSEPYESHIDSINHSYFNNGVDIQNAHNTLRLSYNGILARSGADHIYAVIGYGNNLKWENIECLPMYSISPGNFEVIIPVRRAGNINVAFKDSTNNWDNNSGLNYCFTNYVYEGSH